MSERSSTVRVIEMVLASPRTRTQALTSLRTARRVGVHFDETPGVPLSYRVEDKMRLSKDKTRLAVNPSLTLAGIPPQAFEYRLGNRSALEWVIDQYQLSTDARSGITSDPNRSDDPQYIVRLVGQVIRVSIETMKIVNTLSPQYAPAPSAAKQK